ncbi:MAG: hypothetical protein GY859_26055, partial [Desulfobacterales bacterium]|nr:hypothetical protein [Desulfobacterales bacterium]
MSPRPPATAHKIETMRFHIAFDRGAAALSEQDGLASYLKNHFMPAVNDIFTQYAQSGQKVVIHSLEIDLGAVSLRNYKEELVARVKETLYFLLRDKIRAIRAGASGKDRIITHPESDLETIRYFLRRGLLPWTVGADAPQSPDDLVSGFTPAEFRELALYLKNEFAPDRIQRLVRQFSRQTIQTILKHAPPGIHPNISELSAALERARGPARGGGWGETESSNQSWERLIMALFSKNAKSPPEIEETLQAPGLPEGKAPPPPPRETPDFGPLETIILQAGFPGSESDLARYWQSLLRDWPEETRQVVLTTGKRPDSAQHIAARFPEPRIRELVHLIEPRNSGFIFKVGDNASLFHKAGKLKTPDLPVFKKQLWIFILSYLLVDRGDRFSKKEFLRRLLKRISSHYNVNHGDLLASLITLTKESGIPTTFKEEMLQILAEISHGEGEKDADHPPPQPPDLDMLRAIMTAATFSASEAEIGAYWRTITTKWPGETREFLYKHGKRKKARENLVERFGDSRIMLVIIHLEPENKDFIENV